MAKKKKTGSVKRTAEFWEEFTDSVMQKIPEYYVPWLSAEGPYHPYDIDKHDSVVEFKVRECPDWKFGIWWGYAEDKHVLDDWEGLWTDYGEFFCMHEIGASKFKPQRAAYKGYILINPEGDKNHRVELYDLVKTIQYIHDEPYLAFCRDALGYDYNHEYLSRHEAKKLMKRVFRQKKIHNWLLDRYKKKLYEILMSKFRFITGLKVLEQAGSDFDIEFGSRYFAIAPYEGNEQFFTDGCNYYYLEDSNEKGIGAIEKLYCRYVHLNDRFAGERGSDEFDYPYVIRLVDDKTLQYYMSNRKKEKDGIYYVVGESEED